MDPCSENERIISDNYLGVVVRAFKLLQVVKFLVFLYVMNVASLLTILIVENKSKQALEQAMDFHKYCHMANLHWHWFGAQLRVLEPYT